MIKKELFRKDLYFHLGVIKVEIPSLNERQEDIIPLTNHFLSAFSRKFDKIFNGIFSPAKNVLLQYNWTGNETKAAKLVNLKLNTFRYRRNKLSTE